MKRFLPILAVVGISGFFLGRSLKNLQENSDQTIHQEASYMELPINTRGSTDPESISKEVFEFLEQRSKLTADSFFDLLNKRKKHPLAIIDQLPIYDAVGRIEKADFSSIATRMLPMAGDKFWTETLHVLVYRWAIEDLNGIVAFINGSPTNNVIERAIPVVVNAIAWKSLSKAATFLNEISQSPYNLQAGYIALRNEARNQNDKQLHADLNELLRKRYNYSSGEPLGEVTLETVQAAIANREWETNNGRQLNRMLGELAKNDPTGALEMANLIESPQAQLQALGSVLSNWAGNQPFEALSASFHIFDEFNHYNTGMIGRVLSQALQRDATTAISILESEFGELENSDAALRIVSRYQFGKELIPVLDRIPDSYAKDQILVRMTQRWMREDPEEALDWSREKLDQNSYEKVMIASLPTQTKKDPDAALDSLEIIENPHNLQQALSQVASNWPQNRFSELLDWAVNHEDPNTRDFAMQQMVGPWIRKDVDEARAFAEDLPQGQTRRTYEMMIGNALADSSDPARAIEYANSMMDSEAKERTLRNAFSRIGMSDPLEAVRLLEQQPDLEPRAYENIASTIANNWAQTDIASAANYFVNSPSIENKSSIVSTLTNNWIQIDSNEALNWVASIPTPEVRNQAIESLMYDHRQIEKNPEAYLRLAESIEDPDSRARAFQHLESTLNRIKAGQ